MAVSSNSWAGGDHDGDDKVDDGEDGEDGGEDKVGNGEDGEDEEEDVD